MSVVIDLRARPVEVAVMKKELQASQHNVRAASNQFADVSRTEKAVLMDMPENFEIAFSQMNWWSIAASLKTWTARHLIILPQSSGRHFFGRAIDLSAR
jgi:hypothetical protein